MEATPATTTQGATTMITLTALTIAQQDRLYSTGAHGACERTVVSDDHTPLMALGLVEQDPEFSGCVQRTLEGDRIADEILVDARGAAELDQDRTAAR